MEHFNTASLPWEVGGMVCFEQVSLRQRTTGGRTAEHPPFFMYAYGVQGNGVCCGRRCSGIRELWKFSKTNARRAASLYLLCIMETLVSTALGCSVVLAFCDGHGKQVHLLYLLPADSLEMEQIREKCSFLDH